MAARKAIPDAHTVMRFAQYSKQVIDPDGVAIGVSPAAFSLGPEDKGGLSVTWIEFFGSLDRTSRAAAAVAYRESLASKKLGPKGAFVFAKVEAIKAAAKTFNKVVRVVHDPVDGNPGHAEVRHFTEEDIELLDQLSSNVFGDMELVGSLSLPARPSA